MIGIVTWYSVDKGLGTIVNDKGVRYFFYANRIIMGAIPKVGMDVSFTPSDKPSKKPGQLPVAEQVVVGNIADGFVSVGETVEKVGGGS